MNHSPSLARLIVSSVKVEKVVNAPSIPTKSIVLSVDESEIQLVSSVITPIRKQPVTLATIVPHGKRTVRCCAIVYEIKNREIAPIAPPIAIAIRRVMLIHCPA